MAQTLRNWYLSSLGVVQYLPRGVAKGEPGLNPPGVQHPPQSQETQPAPVLRKHHRILDELQGKETPKAPAVAATPSKIEKAEVHEEPAIQLRLAFWQPSARLVVLSSMPAGMRPGAGQLTMLSRLLKAINALDSALAPFDLIDWPQTEGATGSVKDARDFVAVFLEAKAFLQPFAHVLLMGVESALVASTANSPQVGEQLKIPCGAMGIVTHSLYDMDADASLKGPTWEAIKFLAAH